MPAPETHTRHRRRLEQLVRNEFPGGRVVYLPTSPGALAFQIAGPTGQPRTGVATVPAHHRPKWNAAWLRQLVLRSSGPTAVRTATRAS